MAQLLGAFAEFERELIRERVKAGIETARRKGKRIGRKPMGEDVRQKVIQAFTVGPDRSVRAVAADLQLSRSTVHRIMKDLKAEK